MLNFTKASKSQNILLSRSCIKTGTTSCAAETRLMRKITIMSNLEP